MPLRYKIDVMQALKEKGYNTNRMRKEKLLSESVLQKLRHSEPVSWSNIEQLCRLLDCQPGNIMEYVEE
jgi:putative transcriptional regulator